MRLLKGRINNMNITQEQRTRARRAAGLRPYDSRPVHVIPGGAMPPKLIGHSYFFTTPSGKTVVRYPSAYGWPTQYHCSTRRVVVGERWFDNDMMESI
jgi:hypothetical protein